jgi:hypothetical protein
LFQSDLSDAGLAIVLAILKVDGVKSIYLDDHSLKVKKGYAFDWSELRDGLRSALQEGFADCEGLEIELPTPDFAPPTRRIRWSPANSTTSGTIHYGITYHRLLRPDAQSTCVQVMAPSYLSRDYVCRDLSAEGLGIARDLISLEGITQVLVDLWGVTLIHRSDFPWQELNPAIFESLCRRQNGEPIIDLDNVIRIDVSTFDDDGVQRLAGQLRQLVYKVSVKDTLAGNKYVFSRAA